MYDWVPFFKELSKRLLEEKNDLRDIAVKILGSENSLLRWTIDPFTLVYTIASRSSVDNLQIVKEVLKLKSEIPEDRIFPTPRGNSSRGFHKNGVYDPLHIEDIWVFFEIIAENKLDTNISHYFNETLKIGNVGISKLTQVLFLINPEEFIPIDERTAILFPNKEISELKKIIDTDGYHGYVKLIEDLKNRFFGCEMYEINRLAWALVGEKIQLRYDPSWYQVSSQRDGDKKGDFIEEWYKDSLISLGYTDGDVYENFTKLPRGSIVIVKRGRKLFHGLGVLVTDSISTKPNEWPVNRDIIWLIKDHYSISNNFAINAFCKTQKDEIYNEISERYQSAWEFLETLGSEYIHDNETRDEAKLLSLEPSNTILYGPPGTGKTYETIRKAVELVNPSFESGNNIDPESELSTEERKIVKEEYTRLTELGLILFTTFHQSLSYEDFIEGIKPDLGSDSGDIKYVIESGIFKDICDKAEKNWKKSTDIEDVKFDELWQALVEPLEEDSDVETFVKITTAKSEFKIYEVNDKTIRFEKASGGRAHTLSIKTLWYFFKAPKKIESFGGLKTYYRGLVKHLKNMQKGHVSVKEELKQYVLIIDEINRGNVASIFGELITLIEPDKRMGEPEELSVILPYSKEKFSVPPNLHIIGTMNTADRSVEALDVALRRRFSFEEIMPKPELLGEGTVFDVVPGDYNFPSMLTAINSRIEKLKDRDHTIGHSYFYSLLKCIDESSVKSELINIFKNKIIPLLEEYFYGDWEKIGLVLGKSFIDRNNKKVKFADWYDSYDSDEEFNYTINPDDSWDFKSIYG